MTDLTPDAPRLAATVLLFRQGPKELLEVFLVKRHGSSGFMAGAHVFPGGRVDAQDADFFSELSADEKQFVEQLNEGENDLHRATAFSVAAIRETAEESGVLLARCGGRKATAEEAAEVFAALKKGGDFFTELKRLELKPDLEALSAFSWWLTPKAEPRRYDTRFYAAQIPNKHEAAPDLKETTEGIWLTPKGALRAYATEEIVLAPPTLVTLEELVGVSSFEDVLARAQNPLRCICPKVCHEEEGLVLALPGDPLHDETEAIFSHRTRIIMNATGRFESLNSRSTSAEG